MYLAFMSFKISSLLFSWCVSIKAIISRCLFVKVLLRKSVLFLEEFVWLSGLHNSKKLF